ncbi:MAG: hypothetical protein KatS3mg129_1396 [Leptospiraceae bacterium]|nr:MAG: hypothetical protein KatS3mg129_1396 [Leptospiraceae bacterium]
MKQKYLIFIILILVSCRIEIIEPKKDQGMSPIGWYYLLDMLLNPIPPFSNTDLIKFNVTNNSGSNQTLFRYIKIENEPTCTLKIINYQDNIEPMENIVRYISTFHNAIKEFYIGVESLSLCSNPMTVDSDQYSEYDCEITTSAINCVKMD